MRSFAARCRRSSSFLSHRFDLFTPDPLTNTRSRSDPKAHFPRLPAGDPAKFHLKIYLHNRADQAAATGDSACHQSSEIMTHPRMAAKSSDNRRIAFIRRHSALVPTSSQRSTRLYRGPRSSPRRSMLRAVVNLTRSCFHLVAMVGQVVAMVQSDSFQISFRINGLCIPWSVASGLRCLFRPPLQGGRKSTKLNSNQQL